MFDLNSTFSVVDVETTGQRASDGAIIEIGIVTIRRGVIVDRFRSFVRPSIPVHPSITELTGISDNDLHDAPTFRQLWPEISAYLAESYFVAHNAEFDYGFLKTECARIDEPFYMDRFCTVKLSRKFFANSKRHNLDDLCRRLGIQIKHRHRALDDAVATAEIFTWFLRQANAGEVFSRFAARFEQTSKWLERLTPHLAHIPKTTGVYQFMDVYGLPLYIGKSRNMYTRILSHLRDDNWPRKRKLIHHTDHFETIECDTELEALILESKLIKKHQPPFNVELTRRKGYVFVRVTRDEYPRMYVVREKKSDDAIYIGPFQAAKFAEYLLDNLQRHFKLCPELMRERRTRSGLCFAYHLHQCEGACGEEVPADRYRSTVEEAMDVLFEFTRLDTKKTLDRVLKARALRTTEWSPFRNALRRIKSQLGAIPGIMDRRLLVVHPADEVGYLIVSGLLEKVYRGEELERMNDIREYAMACSIETNETDHVLDERLTIQRYISSNRDKLKLYRIESSEEERHAVV